MPNPPKDETAAQRPLELILARNLMSALSTPAFLVDEGGLLVFYNEAAGTLLGKRFEELGVVGPEEWGSMFGPFDAEGAPLPYDELPLVVAVRNEPGTLLSVLRVFADHGLNMHKLESRPSRERAWE